MISGQSAVSIVPNQSNEILKFVLERYADAFELGLRDQLQIAIILDAALLSLQDAKIHIFFLVFLAVLYQQNPVVFARVAQTKNLSEAGFGAIDKKNNLGGVLVAVADSRGEYVNKYIKLISIVNIYFGALETPMRVYNDRSPNIRDFPENLLINLIGERVGGSFRASFSNYFSLIQHAGGFVLR